MVYETMVISQNSRVSHHITHQIDHAMFADIRHRNKVIFNEMFKQEHIFIPMMTNGKKK
jgi:hypothetical protein